jgi:zinc protease
MRGGMMRLAGLFLGLLVACGGGQPSTTFPSPMPPPPGPASPSDPVASPGKPIANAKLTKVRSVEGITEYQLGNGLQVLLFPDATQSTFTVNITYLVGSRHEGYGETGMAHLLEHMLFKGTPTHRNVLKLLGERGAQSNGTTWNDRTNYYETLAATPENLTFALELEADRMINASISADDLKTEFSVVRNEFERNENNPSAVLSERIWSTAYLWHNYGKSTIGSRADIEKVPVPALRAFYEKYYQPDNAMLVVAGKFDQAAALAIIEKKFGAIPRPARKLPPTYTLEPVQDGERQVTLRRNGDVHIVSLAYHTVGGASPDFPVGQAALDTLVRKPSGTLYKKLVETKLAANVSGVHYMFRDPTLLEIEVEIRDPKNVAKVEQILLAGVEGLASAKLEDRAVERWRAQTLKDIELAFANSGLSAIRLSEFAALGDWRTAFAYRDRVGKVTTADVQQFAKTFLKSSNRTLGRFIPTKDADRAPLTETPDVAAIVKGIEGGQAAEQGEAFAATFENLDARTTRKELKGGLKASLLPKKTRGGRVLLSLSLHWGDEKSLKDKQVIALVAAEMLKRGTTKRTYQDLQDEENILRSRIRFSGGVAGWAARIETVRDKLGGSIDLVAEMLKTPRFDAKQLELVRQELLARYEQQLQDPGTVVSQTLSQLTTQWPKGDPRQVLSTAERIAALKKITVADLKAFHRDFVGANHGEVAAVGDFDAAAISAQLEKHFGGWASKKPYARLTDKPFGLAAVQKSIEIKDKEMTQIAFGHDLAMKDSDADYPAWALVGHVLGGDASSRLWMRLREKDGLSYGTWAWANADSFDSSGSFGGGAIVAPQNVAKAKAAILEEINRLISTKLTEDEIRRAKEGWTKSLDTDLANDGVVLFFLNDLTYRGRTFAFLKDLRAKVLAVTSADVARVAKQHIQPGKLFMIDAGSNPAAAAPKK